MTVTAALRDSRAARARLEAIYGHVPPVVYFVQREDGGSVKIGRALRIAEVLAEPRTSLYISTDRVHVRAAVPGGQPLMRWFQDRHKDRRAAGDWFDEPEAVIEDARRFGYTHARCVTLGGADMGGATLASIRACDPFLADFERLYRAGATLRVIAGIAGISERRASKTADHMRALGFYVPHRRVYVSKPRWKENAA